MVYFIQFRSPTLAKREQAMLRHNFPKIQFTFVNGLQAYDTDVICSGASIVVLGGSSELFIDRVEQSKLSGSIESIVRQAQELIKQAELDGVPILGICFGHQLIAKSLGGEVQNEPAMAEVGIGMIELAAGSYQAAQGHKESVVKLPPGAKVLGSSAVCANQIVRYDEHLLGVQFHPEMTVLDTIQRMGQAIGYTYQNADSNAPINACDEANARLQRTLERADLCHMSENKS